MNQPTDANGRQRTPTDAPRLRETIQEYLTEHYDYFREQNDHPGLSMHTETYTDISDWFDALADAAIAAMVTALLSEPAVTAAMAVIEYRSHEPFAAQDWKEQIDDWHETVTAAFDAAMGGEQK